MNYAEDGNLSHYEHDEIADAAQWDGDPTLFIDSMLNCGPGQKCGFLELVEGELFVHDWQVYIGRLLEKREQNRQRKRKSRASNNEIPQEETPEEFQNENDTHENGRVADAQCDDIGQSRASHADDTRQSRVSHRATNQPTEPTKPTEPNIKDKTSSVRNEEPLRTVEDEKPPDESLDNPPPSEDVIDTEPSDVEAMDDKPSGREAVTVSGVTKLWNEMLVPLGFRSLKKPSPARTRHFNARIREGPERRSLDWWRELLSQIANSSWLVDQARKKANWLDFDWVINPSNLTKILEGKYDSNPDNPIIDDRLWCVRDEDGSHGEFYYATLEDAERNARFKELRDEKTSLMEELVASGAPPDPVKMARIEELKVLMGLQPEGGETAYG